MKKPTRVRLVISCAAGRGAADYVQLLYVRVCVCLSVCPSVHVYVIISCVQNSASTELAKSNSRWTKFLPMTVL